MYGIKCVTQTIPFDEWMKTSPMDWNTMIETPIMRSVVSPIIPFGINDWMKATESRWNQDTTTMALKSRSEPRNGVVTLYQQDCPACPPCFNCHLPQNQCLNGGSCDDSGLCVCPAGWGKSLRAIWQFMTANMNGFQWTCCWLYVVWWHNGTRLTAPSRQTRLLRASMWFSWSTWTKATTRWQLWMWSRVSSKEMDL